MQFYYPCPDYKGRHDIIIPTDNEFMGFSLVKLGNQESHDNCSGSYEIALVILSGKATVTVDGQEFEQLGTRADIFSGRATTVYIPRDSQYRITALTDNFEAALCQVRTEKKYSPFVVPPEEVKVNHRGTQLWQRDVHDIIVDNGEGRVERIVVGETYSVPGNWSSFPSHKHDRHRPPQETELVEIYHFRVEPVNRFGVQLLYTEDGKINEAFMVKDRDTFKIPCGYHPVAAPPGVKLYYLWFLAGDHGRQMIPYDDPAFRDLRELEAV
ncbi:5-deoxy-glucuronate isomerase [Neomoorella thermoacetica]|uniref:5-deoxy-glucuronate isomerase n=1 Tax=Neomoorella thermoacetica TaxID=1525 RepID=UPI0008FB6FDE|nr:5-deoxy-glucuronate isomerase [Moorella thermoacetica]APC07508.1 5-deoxy-glucuronate isomerase [Moorella thermoacetica]